MKYVKTLAVSATVAAALIAVLGSGTASATVLCKNNGNTAACSEPFPATTLIEAQATTFSFMEPMKTGLPGVECEKAAIGGRTENQGSSTATVNLPDTANNEKLIVTFEKCSCEVKVVTPGDLELHHIVTTDNATVTSTGLEITTGCSTIFGPVHCIFKTNKTDLGTLKGGNPAKLQINASLEGVTTAGLCTNEVSWLVEYELTTPKPLWVAAG